MLEDFHYYAVKALAREAGFTADEAQIIAYASQYADDAVEHMPLRIKNLPPDLNFDQRIRGEHFDPVCTAHSGMQHVKGIKKDAQRKIYIAFHYLPPEPYDGSGRYDYCCAPDGLFARMLIRNAVDGLNAANKENRMRRLIRLGLALHTYADNWSHQRFSGRHSSADNDIERIRISINGTYAALPSFSRLKLNMLPDIGHAEALDYPDQSRLDWKYTHDASGIEYVRNNTAIFLDCARAIFNLFCELNHFTGRRDRPAEKLETCFSFSSEALTDKCQKYREVFDHIDFDYDAKAWRDQALKGGPFEWIDFEKKDYKDQVYEFNGDRKWFYFHMAAYEQRMFVLNHIKYDLT